MYRPITHTCFILTEECNFRCKYCFYKKYPKKMSYETAKKSVDWIVRQNPTGKEFHIQFFGGEPLLEWNLLTKIVDYTKKYSKKWYFGITTNGSLLTDERLDYCIKNNIDILFSIDGTPEAHNTHRVLPDGSGSFKLIDPWIPKLVKSGICNVARLTYTPDTLSMLYDSIKYLKGRGFKYVAPTPAIDSYHHFTKKDIEEWKKQYAFITKEYKDSILAGVNPGANYYEKCWRQIIYGTKLPSPCGAGKAYVGISYDGGIYPCHRFVQWPEWCIGNVEEGITDEKKRDIFLNHDINKLNNECSKCDNMFCGGTCLAANYENNKDITKPSKDGCMIYKEQFKNAKKLYEELKDTEQFKKIYQRYYRKPKNNQINLATINKRLDKIEKLLINLSHVVLDNIEEGSEFIEQSNNN